MNSELEPLRVHPIGQRLEACSVGRGREAARNRNQNSVLVPKVFFLLERVAEGIGHIPALVDDSILPSVPLYRAEHRSIGFKVGLVDRQAIGIPTVPAHWRCGRERLCVAESGGRNDDGEKKGGK